MRKSVVHYRYMRECMSAVMVGWKVGIQLEHLEEGVCLSVMG